MRGDNEPSNPRTDEISDQKSRILILLGVRERGEKGKEREEEKENAIHLRPQKYY